MKIAPILTKTDRYTASTEDAVRILLKNNDIAFDIFNEMNTKIVRLERRSRLMMVISTVAVAAACLSWGVIDENTTRIKAIERQLKAEADDEDHFTVRG